jgi:hypothetical protein
MEADTRVADERRPPFLWIENAAYDAIVNGTDSTTRALSISVYTTLARAASAARDGTHAEGFKATRGQLANAAGASVRTVDKYLDVLVECGVLEVTPGERVGQRQPPSIYRLLSVQQLHAETGPQGATAAPSADSQGARAASSERSQGATAAPLKRSTAMDGGLRDQEERVESRDSTPPKGKAPKVWQAPLVVELCDLLADAIAAADGGKRPVVNQTWQEECERLMRLDGATPEQIRYAIPWTQRHAFWGRNILSMPTLRKQWRRIAREIAQEKNGSGRASARRAAQDERQQRRAERLRGAA